MAASNSDQTTGVHDQPADQDAGSTPPEKASSKKPPRPSQCRNFTRQAVAESLPDIVETFVGEAKSGSVSHFNLLSKFGGFDLRPAPEPRRHRGKSFAHRLLDNMKEHEAKRIAANQARIAAERGTGK